MESINKPYSNAYQSEPDETKKSSFHQICLEDVGRIKTENKSLKLELKCMKELYDALIQRHSIVEESRDRNATDCKEKENQIKELMIFKRKILTLKDELKVLKGDFFFIILLTNVILVFEDLFWILESKEIEIKELQITTKEHESCQKEAESSRDQLKSVESESAGSESLLVEEDDDYCEIIEESSRPEYIREKEITNRFRLQQNHFKYKIKSIRVNRFKIFLQ
jgi:hypothetical protein